MEKRKDEDFDDFNTTMDSLSLWVRWPGFKELSWSFILSEESKEILPKVSVKRRLPAEGDEKGWQFSVLLDSETAIPVKK